MTVFLLCMIDLFQLHVQETNVERQKKSEIKNKFEVSSKKISFGIINYYWARKYMDLPTKFN